MSYRGRSQGLAFVVIYLLICTVIIIGLTTYESII